MLITSVVLIATAISLLVMMYPILCKVQLETLHQVFRKRNLDPECVPHCNELARSSFLDGESSVSLNATCKRLRSVSSVFLGHSYQTRAGSAKD